jgi:hypothetical protein
VIVCTHPFSIGRLQNNALKSFSETPSSSFTSWDSQHGPILFVEHVNGIEVVASLGAEELVEHLVVQLHHISATRIFFDHVILLRECS